MATNITATPLNLSAVLKDGSEVAFTDGRFIWETMGTWGPITVEATIPQMRDLVPVAVRYAGWDEAECQPVKDWLNSLIDSDQSQHELGEIIDRRDRWQHDAGLLGETSLHIHEALIRLTKEWTDRREWPATAYQAGDQVWVRCQPPITDRV